MTEPKQGLDEVRPQRGLVATAQILTQVFTEIENPVLSPAIPGLTCGFYDLDALTQGFSRSDLIIVAARPAMGKTSFGLNIARHIAAQHRQPVALFSLGMAREQLVQWLLASECQIEGSRLRSGRISQAEWKPLGQAISVLSQLPLFIDDTANTTVTEMHSQARQLQSEQGNALGLILVDYLQLMEGAPPITGPRSSRGLPGALRGWPGS